MNRVIHFAGSTIKIESIFRYRIVPRELFVSYPYCVELEYDFNPLATIPNWAGLATFKTASVNCASHEEALKVFSSVCDTLKEAAKERLKEIDIKIAALKEKDRQFESTKMPADE